MYMKKCHITLGLSQTTVTHYLCYSCSCIPQDAFFEGYIKGSLWKSFSQTRYIRTSVVHTAIPYNTNLLVRATHGDITVDKLTCGKILCSEGISYLQRILRLCSLK